MRSPRTITSRHLVAIISFVLVATLLGDQNVRLQSDQNPITFGVPFRLEGIIHLDEWESTTTVACNVTADDHVTFLSTPHMGINITSEHELLTLDAIVWECPESITIDTLTALLSCNQTTGNSSETLSDDLPLRLKRGSIIKPDIEVSTSDPLIVQLRLENIVHAVPEEGVSCAIQWDPTALILDPKTSTLNTTWWNELDQPQGALENNTCDDHLTSCRFGDFIDHTVKTLSLAFTRTKSGDDDVPTRIELSCKSDTDCIVAELNKTVTLPQKTSVKMKSDVTEVSAGKAVNLTLSGKGITDSCKVTLPSALHLKAVPKGCDPALSCDLKKGDITLPLHVNASASGDIVSSVACAHDKVTDQISLKVKKEANLTVSIVKQLPSKKTLLTLRTTVANNGPSDAIDTSCDVNFPLGIMFYILKPPVGVNCSVNKCNISHLAGWDDNEKPRNSSATFVTTVDFAPDGEPAPQVKIGVCCTTNDDSKKACAEIAVNKTDTIPSSSDDNKKPSTNDNADFWTYTIVIVNLFMIALVVFIGMWWRNRAIARSQAGLPLRMEQEMELMSGERTVGKAD